MGAAQVSTRALGGVGVSPMSHRRTAVAAHVCVSPVRAVARGICRLRRLSDSSAVGVDLCGNATFHGVVPGLPRLWRHLIELDGGGGVARSADLEEIFRLPFSQEGKFAGDRGDESSCQVV